MKRYLLVVFTLCNLCLLIGAGTVIAAKAGYTHTVYGQTASVTFDGKWTNSGEWTDGFATTITPNSIFRSKYNFVSFDPLLVTQNFLVEILNDSTNDAGDYWQICFDGDMSGGTAPGTGDLRIDIVGHTTVTWYSGTGTGWAPMATPSATQFQWNNSIASSMHSSTPHWILELMLDKALGPGPQFWARVAVYDASNAAAGVHAWPPTSRDVPADYGDFPYTMDPIPEGLSFGAAALLSSVAVIVGAAYLRKRTRNPIVTTTKP